jgi:SAM-dependent methyltransferase
MNMPSDLRPIAAFAFLALFLAPAAHARHTGMPAGMTREQHMARMKSEAELQQGHMPDHTGQKGAHDEPVAQADHFGRHFEDAAEWAKTFDDPARDEWQLPSRVIDALQLKSAQLVADIGAGTGYFTVRLAKSPAAPTVFAVDIEPSMVEYVKERAAREGLKNVVAVQAGADRTNLPAPVDVALVVDTYHHIPNRVAYFTALKALLKPGARLAVIDFRKDSPEGPPVEFRFTPDQITAELAKAGFSLQTSHDFLPRQHFLIYGVK